MEIEGGGVSGKRYARSDELDAMLPQFGHSDETMDSASHTLLPRSYYTDGLTSEVCSIVCFCMGSVGRRTGMCMNICMTCYSYVYIMV